MTVPLKFGKILNAVSGKYHESGNSLVLDYPCSTQTSCHSVEVVLFAGKYELSVWGAEGGGCGSSAGELGGKGGYSKGTISFQRETKLLFFIGGKGIPGGGSTNAEAQGGFNGGGKGYSGTTTDTAFGPSGGGASDIRFEDNITILIAGGGGGSSFFYQRSGNYSGGFGGGLSGGSGGDSRGLGGNQTDNGFCQYNPTITAATRGNGRNGGNGQPGSYGSGGGGGGYFGGGGGFSGGGGGGSGFVSSMFENGITMNGAESFQSSKTSTNETGHIGNGNAKITLLSSNKIPFCTNRPKNRRKLKMFPSSLFLVIVFQGIDSHFHIFSTIDIH